MSATVTPPSVKMPATPVVEVAKSVDATVVAQAAENDSLLNQQFILAGITLTLIAVALAIVLWRGDDGNTKLILGFIFGVGLNVNSFYFGSSKSSQTKDTTLAAQLPAIPTTTAIVPKL